MMTNGRTGLRGSKKKSPVPDKPVYFSQVLDRVMQTLDCFTDASPELRFTELSRLSRLHKSTLYRLLEAMRSYGLIEQDSTTRKYHLGLKMLELGGLAAGRLEIGKCATPALERLAAETRETSHLCILDGMDVVYISKVEGTHAFHVPSRVGRRNPAYCTGVGKAILAHVSSEERNAYLRRLAKTRMIAFTKKTISAPSVLENQLDTIKQRGYSLDDEEISEGLRCIGVPIWNHEGRCVAGISIAGPKVRMEDDKLAELAKSVIGAAEAISRKLGYSGTLKCPSAARVVSGRVKPAVPHWG
jgi:DNA-binding IclR family transcriptional regulator